LRSQRRRRHREHWYPLTCILSLLSYYHSLWSRTVITHVYMSLSNRHDEQNTDEENDETIDPELRLRTVRTAASAIAESIRTDQRAERRRSTIHKRSRFFRSKHADKKPDSTTSSTSAVAPAASRIPGARRNIYVNHPLSAMEVDHNGEPKVGYVRNKVRTTSESFHHLLCLSNHGFHFFQSLFRVYHFHIYSQKSL
jgi:hypothetical protein